MAKEPPPEETPRSEPREPTGKKDDKVGWINRLAQRSTGLPEHRENPVPQDRSPWSLAGVGLQFAATVAVFAFFGYYLDRRFNWTPWGTIGLAAFGFVGGLYLLIKQFLKDQGGK